ncbi:adenosylhomocysteinase [Thermanaerosceptrum fracticalcis]|uniref:Adenosylhomocysteinase n=1 Tax=Thermanaerosceptrum fracticalcis TaxID=1712410 RepID=A0A7G6E147_THEFR|nr:adenosylhomocysteinase [Thermanaerosceptrum fracticalcis]QNB45801.1 adenosylhomocysteinase [Thermanaerosceptrum fracticalcis]
MLKESQIRDINLAPKGEQKLSWVQKFMPILNQIKDKFSAEQPFAGKKVVICLHLEAKTGYLAQVIKAGGAEVTVVASNPLSTQDDVVAALVQNGIRAYAWHGATDAEYHQHLKLALETEPNLIIDDGGDLVSLLHGEYQHLIPAVTGSCEETTTGLIRLRSMEKTGVLKIPVVAVNDAYMKYLFDNRYGTGQSVWDAITNTTNLVVAGKNVVVVGYGWCGKGVALRAKGLGARVIVTEIDPIKANEAILDGFEVLPMQKAAALGDFFITVTGNKAVIRKEHFSVMADGAILANAGHFDVEISKPDLKELAVSVRTVKPNVEEFVLQDGRKLFLLAEGRLVNLASGNGHPVEIMDLSFGIQALSLAYLEKNREQLRPGVIPVPTEIDQGVARLRLEALGRQIDELTPEQKQYLNDWAM